MIRARSLAAVAAGVGAAEGTLVHLGRTFGSTEAERAMRIPGDDIVADPVAVTNHAITIDAPPECVWPCLVQMGWGRAGWYTARWNRARLDWSWAFHLTPIGGGWGTRYLFRSRWMTSPWWLTAGGWLGIVSADSVMSRDHLHGVRERAERIGAA